MSKMRKYLWMTLGVIMVMSMAALVWATTITEGFETWTGSTSYGTYYINGWKIVNGLREAGANLVHAGVNGVRLRNSKSPDATTDPYIEYFSTNADSAGKDGGVGTFSFYYRRWRSGSNKFYVMYKQGAGAWTVVDTTVLPAQSPNDTTWQLYTRNLNILGDNIKVRVTNFTAGGNVQLPLDDFSITDYTGGDTQPPAVSAVAQTSTTAVDVTFSEDVDQTTAETAGNYKVNPGSTALTASGAIRDGTNHALVHLTFGTAFPAGADTVDANGVKDLSNNACVHSQGFFNVDGTPPSITNVTVISHTALDILFSENVTSASAGTTSNYLVMFANVAPATAARDVTNLRLVHLTFSSALPVASDSVNVNGVQDESFAHNACVNIHGYFTMPSVNAGDVVITEVMYDSFGADSEWVEIHNTTASPIDISHWVMIDAGTYPGPGTEGELTIPASTTLGAGAYMVLSPTVQPSLAPVVPVVCTAAGSFVLANTRDNLALYTSHTGGLLVDGSLEKQYPALAGDNSGTSIEKCNVNAPWDSVLTAWHRSGNVFALSGPFRYCTPGANNTSCTDNIPPTLSSISVVNLTTLDVAFSEDVQQGPAEIVTNYLINNSIGTPSLAVRQAAHNVVRLTVSTLSYTSYVLTVNNIVDLNGNVILPNSTIPFTVIEPPSLKFTELMPNPKFPGLADSLGEWFEIYNGGTQAINMSGWVIGDNSGSDTLTGTVIINSGQYFVFCSNGDSATNGGVPENYAYPYATSGHGLALGNTQDSIWLQDASFNPVIALKYTNAFNFGPGRSTQLRNLTDDFTVAANWCLADTIPWPGAWNGDKGTPGAATVCAANQNFTLCDVRSQDACGVPDLLGMRVAVTGVITYTDSCRKNAYIEWDGCAVMIYGNFVRNLMFNSTRRMAVGDFVRLVSNVTQFNGLTEFSLVTGDSIVFISEGNPVPSPTTISPSAIDMGSSTCSSEQYESKHVAIPGVHFMDTGNFVANTNYNLASNSGDTVQFRVNACDLYLVGQPIPQYNLTLNGTLGQFKRLSCYCDSFQVTTGRVPAYTVLCATPLEVTAYKVGVDSVGLRWLPGVNQVCNCYSIYYADTQDGTYTLLANVTGVTEYIDATSPMSTLRFYKVTAGGQGCP